MVFSGLGRVGQIRGTRGLAGGLARTQYNVGRLIFSEVCNVTPRVLSLTDERRPVRTTLRASQKRVAPISYP